MSTHSATNRIAPNRTAMLRAGLALSLQRTSPYCSGADCRNALCLLFRRSEGLIKMVFFGHCISKMNCEEHQTQMPKRRV